MTPLYPRLLGAAWSRLPECVRRCHAEGGEVRSSGEFDVRWGETRLARFLARLGGLPSAGERIPIELTVTPHGRGEIWRRSFDGEEFVTEQWEEGSLLVERSGVFELRFLLEVVSGQLRFRQTGASVCLGPASLRLPRWLAPRVTARAWEDGDTRVQVEVSVPGAGILCRYEGALRAEARP